MVVVVVDAMYCMYIPLGVKPLGVRGNPNLYKGALSLARWDIVSYLYLSMYARIGNL